MNKRNRFSPEVRERAARYDPRVKDDEPALTTRIIALAVEYGRYGYYDSTFAMASLRFPDVPGKVTCQAPQEDRTATMIRSLSP